MAADPSSSTYESQEGIIEDWAESYFPAATLLDELAATAQSTIPQAAWSKFVNDTEDGHRSDKPEHIEDEELKRLCLLGRKLHRANCFVVSRISSSLAVGAEEVHFLADGAKRVGAVTSSGEVRLSETAEATNDQTPSESVDDILRRRRRALEAELKAAEQTSLKFIDITSDCSDSDSEDQSIVPPLKVTEPFAPRSPDAEALHTSGQSFDFDFVQPPALLGSRSFAFSPETQNQQLIDAVDAADLFNHDLSRVLKEHVSRVSAFYQRTTVIVSGTAATCIDQLKMLENLNRRQRAKLEKTIHQAAYSFSMLQEFCDHNYVTISKFLQDVGRLSFQRIEPGTAILKQPFFMTRQNSSIAELRDVLIEEYTRLMCSGDRVEAEARLSRFVDADDSLTGGRYSVVRLTNSTLNFVVGVCAGATLATAIVVMFLFAGQQFSLHHTHHGEHAAYLFAITGVPILFGLLFAINVLIWERYRINFAFSFQLHPFRHFTSRSVLLMNGGLSLIWLACAFFYVRAATIEFADLEASWAVGAIDTCLERIQTLESNCTGSACASQSGSGVDVHAVRQLLLATIERSSDAPLVPAYIWPYMVVPLCLLVFLIGRLLRGRHKGFFLRSLLRVLVTPLFPCTFTDFFVCEQLVSLSDVFFEWTWMFCVFNNTDTKTGHVCREGRAMFVYVLGALPPLWRTMQSLRRFRDNPTQRSFYPHLLNAFKYFLSLVRMAVQAWFYVEYHGYAQETGEDEVDEDSVHVERDDDARLAALIVFCTVYTVETLVKMGYETWVEYGVLRCNARFTLLRDTILLPQWMYYPCMAMNFVIRWLWILKLLITKVWSKDPFWAFPVFAAVEVWRRIMWNTFRVEYDQVDNTENYKAVQLAPLQSIRHASGSVDWQLTEEDIEALPRGSATTSSPLSPSTHAFGDVAEKTMSSAVAFFRGLPHTERVEVLRAVLSDQEHSVEVVRGNTYHRVAHASALVSSTRLFRTLHEEDKIRALLLRAGPDRTSHAFYADVVGSAHPTPTAAPSLHDSGDGSGHRSAQPTPQGSSDASTTTHTM